MERKKGRMVHVAQDIFGSGNDMWISWHTGRILEAIPTDEMAKKLATLTDMTSNKKITQKKNML